MPLPLPLIVGGAALALAGPRQAEYMSTAGDPEAPIGLEPTPNIPAAPSLPHRAFATAVEAWRTDVTAYCTQYDIAPDMALYWIARESGGNPAATGLKGYEAGIFQLYFEPGQSLYGATFAALRVYCVGTSQLLARQLTAAERRLQVTSGIDMLNAERARVRVQLTAAGVSWSTHDEWALVKLRHCIPALVTEGLPRITAAIGHGPESWSAFKAAVNQLGVPSVSPGAAKRGWRTGSDSKLGLDGRGIWAFCEAVASYSEVANPPSTVVQSLGLKAIGGARAAIQGVES